MSERAAVLCIDRYVAAHGELQGATGHLHDALGPYAFLEEYSAHSGIHCAQGIIQQHDVSSGVGCPC